MEEFLFFFTISICFALALVSLKNAKALNPQLLFCGFIGIIFSLASLKLYGISEQILPIVFIITILGVLSFSFGVEIAHSTIITHAQNHSYTYVLKAKFVRYVVYILLAWTIYRLATTVMPLLLSGRSLDYVRMVYFGQEVDGIAKSDLDGIIETFINQPFLYAVMVITSYDIFQSKENRRLDNLTIVFVFIWIILSCLITGGRLLVFFLMLSLVFGWLINKKARTIHHVRNKKGKYITIGVIGLLIYILYVFSLGRNDDGTYDLWHGLYLYFSGCVPHTSIRMHGDTAYTYGMTLFSGLLRPVMLAYKYTVGGGQFPELYQRSIDIAFTLQEAVTINKSGEDFNAFALPFYYFFIDGDIIGVVIDSFIYGYFCGYTYFRAIRTKNHRDYSLYLIVLVYIFSSMVRFSPYIVAQMYSYIFVMFCYKKVIIKNQN